MLWLSGEPDTGSDELLCVDADAEPDVLLEVREFDLRLDALTWDGTHLWALRSSRFVLRIDPLTFEVLETYLLPDYRDDWQGIAAVGDQLSVIGQRDDEGVLVELES